MNTLLEHISEQSRTTFKTVVKLVNKDSAHYDEVAKLNDLCT